MKFFRNFAKFSEFCKFCKKKLANFDKKNEITELCKGVHCVDLGESFQTHIYLQNLASIQPRTRPLKFAASRDVTGHAAEAAAAADAYGGTHVIVCCVPIATSFVVSCSRFLFSETAFSRRSINTKCHALTSISQRCLLCRPEDSFF